MQQRVYPGPDPSHPFVDDVTAKLTDDPHADRSKAALPEMECSRSWG
ncbi:hypothetical protein MMRN_29240 [Mycobacterium marinum]|nr:hypothetical protein CCUG20998_02737 [Mycobacterium marinum]RFZ20395.1 hypothetical protein DSM44344_03939 [Mycobacterium marinum]RFZ22776.1 hypothetical protein DSM43519_02878 [Mycobacterium marinum]RFZ27125.1 hypothetical protein NCTC2275_04657 [Mycobacterium marinum]BBC66028.1 hypothetical protein MMRN_29240 [Mycobacterium marinum]